MPDCSVKFKILYEFNDITDRNMKYITDRIKSAFAAGISLGQARPFKTHIWWEDTTYKFPLTKDDKGWPLEKK